MKTRSFQRLVFSFLLFGMSHIALAKAVDIGDGLATASARCGYDLTDLKSSVTAANVEAFSPSGVKVSFRLELKRRKQLMSARLSISCADPLNNAASQGGNVPDAQAVIQEEDAGGRYFRHVASQKLIKGRNWLVNVAVIDYVLGDAQPIKENELLACNAEVLAPCISLRVDKPRRLSQKDLNLLYLLFEQIAVIRVVDVDVGTGAAK